MAPRESVATSPAPIASCSSAGLAWSVPLRDRARPSPWHRQSDSQPASRTLRALDPPSCRARPPSCRVFPTSPRRLLSFGRSERTQTVDPLFTICFPADRSHRARTGPPPKTPCRQPELFNGHRSLGDPPQMGLIASAMAPGCARSRRSRAACSALRGHACRRRRRASAPSRCGIARPDQGGLRCRSCAAGRTRGFDVAVTPAPEIRRHAASFLMCANRRRAAVVDQADAPRESSMARY